MLDKRGRHTSVTVPRKAEIQMKAAEGKKNAVQIHSSVTESHIFLRHMSSKFFAVSRNYANCCHVSWNHAKCKLTLAVTPSN